MRTNSEAVDRWLAETFGEYEVDEPTAPYYSVLFGASENGKVGQSYHILYEESRALVRTLDLRTLGEVLVGQFEHVAAAERSDLVFLDEALVRLGDVYALVPPIIPPYLANLSRRVIDRTGLKLPGTTYVALDPASGAIVPAGLTLDLPTDAPEALAALAPTKRREELARVTEPVRPDLVSFIGLAEERVTRYSPARAAQILATRILNIDQVGGAGVEAVATLVRGTPCYETRSAQVEETLEILVELLGSVGQQVSAGPVPA
ncbi:MAG TPA: hypothetical protein VFR32_00960 [Gaiellaceae bacterium]|nr:hypothetical protein [Gaiellaceae bacterium]